MTPRLFPAATVLFALLLLPSLGYTQTADRTAALSPAPLHTFSSSSTASSAEAFVTLPPTGLPRPKSFHHFTGIGIASRTGLPAQASTSLRLYRENSTSASEPASSPTPPHFRSREPTSPSTSA